MLGSNYTAAQVLSYCVTYGLATPKGDMIDQVGIYRAAYALGVFGYEIDAAFRLAPGTADTWVMQQGYAPLRGVVTNANYVPPRQAPAQPPPVTVVVVPPQAGATPAPPVVYHPVSNPGPNYPPVTVVPPASQPVIPGAAPAPAPVQFDPGTVIYPGSETDTSMPKTALFVGLGLLAVLMLKKKG